MRGNMTEEEVKSEANGTESEEANSVAETHPAAHAVGEPEQRWRRCRRCGCRRGGYPQNPNMKWYIIHTYSGFERKVKESLE